jgi:hypothetical protein
VVLEVVSSESDVPATLLLADVGRFPAGIHLDRGTHCGILDQAVRLSVSEAGPSVADVHRAAVYLVHRGFVRRVSRGKVHRRILSRLLDDQSEHILKEVVDFTAKRLQASRGRAREGAAEVIVPPAENPRVETADLGCQFGYGDGVWGRDRRYAKVARAG